MDFLSLFLAGIAVYLTCAVLSFSVRSKYKGLIILAGCIVGGLMVSTAAVKCLYSGKSATITIAANFPFNDIVLRLDPLAAFFILVIAIGALFSVWYGCSYLLPYSRKGYPLSAHFLFLVLLIVAMLVLTVVRNSVAFLVLWEIMSLSSFFLVIFEHEKPEVLSAGIFYLVTMHISFVCLMLGFLVLMRTTGSNDFDSYHVFFNSEAYRPVADCAFILFLIGFGIKAGFLPLHNWLPAAHTAAPSHVSGLMSGVMIKMGIFGICLMIAVLGVPSLWLCYLVTLMAVATALFGIFYASVKDDFKRVLAYSSIENIGIIGLGIGVGLLGMSYGNMAMAMLGLSGALLHVLNHSLFKGLLFYGAGSVYLQTHTRNLNLLGGIYRKMPGTGILFLAGCLAVCGLPPFNGFVSKFIIYYAMLSSKGISDAGIIFTATISFTLLALVGAVAVLCFTRLFGILFFGAPRSSLSASASESSRFALMPMVFLAILCLLGGLFPGILLRGVEFPAEMIVGHPAPGITVELGKPLQSIAILFITMIIMSMILFGIRSLLLCRHRERNAPTWGCGYNHISNRMQYTAASFSMPFIELIKPAMKKVEGGGKVKGLFPDANAYIFKIKDIFELGVIRPLGERIVFLLGRFSWIQDGNMQHYLFYGMIFLIGALIWVVFG